MVYQLVVVSKRSDFISNFSKPSASLDFCSTFLVILMFSLFYVSSLLSKFGDRSREFSKCDDKIHYLILLNPKNLDMFIYIYVDEEKRLAVSF